MAPLPFTTRRALGLALALSAFGACGRRDAPPAAPPANGGAAAAPPSATAPPSAEAQTAPPATKGATAPPNAEPAPGPPVEPLPPDAGRKSPPGRHHPAALDEPPKRASIRPGPYACKVSAEYKLRNCTVERDAEGYTWLTVHEENLIAVKGLLWDEGAELVFEGWLTERRPFGCFACQERCAAPGSCVCQELVPEASAECLRQPEKIRFRRGGGGYQGRLTHVLYFNDYGGEGAARRVAGFERKPEKFAVTLAPAGR